MVQVRRLWRKRQELTTAEIEARSEVDKLKQIISRVDVEYQVLHPGPRLLSFLPACCAGSAANAGLAILVLNSLRLCRAFLTPLRLWRGPPIG